MGGYEYNTYSAYETALSANYNASTGSFGGDTGLQLETKAFLSYYDTANIADMGTAFQAFIEDPSSPSWWQGDFVITNQILPNGQIGIPKLAVFGGGAAILLLIMFK